AVTCRHDDAALIPPLQLPRRDARQRHYLFGCELDRHSAPYSMFKTFLPINVAKHSLLRMFQTFYGLGVESQEKCARNQEGKTGAVRRLEDSAADEMNNL